MTETAYTSARAADFAEGDTARATLDNVTVVAPVALDRRYGLFLDVPFSDIDEDDIELLSLEDNGWTLEKATKSLPTTVFTTLAPVAGSTAAHAHLTKSGWVWLYADGTTYPASTSTISARLNDGEYVIAFEGVAE